MCPKRNHMAHREREGDLGKASGVGSRKCQVWMCVRECVRIAVCGCNQLWRFNLIAQWPAHVHYMHTYVHVGGKADIARPRNILCAYEMGHGTAVAERRNAGE